MLLEKFKGTGGNPVKDKKILILTTGGTILSVYDQDKKSIALELKGEELLNPVLKEFRNTKINVQEFSQLPGPHLTPELALQLATEIEEYQEHYDGIVVLQGTDTIEEFAYLVSLLTNSKKPIVFTGAMRCQNDYYSDWLGNVASAVIIASSDKTQGRGVLVTFNEKIYSPIELTKMHTTNIDSFQSPNTGPIGHISNEEPHYYSKNEYQEIFEKKLESNVELLKVTFGSNPRALENYLDMGVKGFVIEALGSGNVPPSWVPIIKKVIDKGIPVIVTSRCVMGGVHPVYNYEGGGRILQSIGAIFAERLSGPKARIKLMVLLGQSKKLTMEEIQLKFDDRCQPVYN